MNARPITPLAHSILLRMGVAVSMIAMLALLSNLVSMVITDNSSGRAQAINLSGSLRMLTHRISAQALAHESPQSINANVHLVESRIAALIPLTGSNAHRRAIADTALSQAMQAVQHEWQNQFLPTVAAYLAHERTDEAGAIYRASWTMVERADVLVKVLEDDLEDKIILLRWVVAIALVLGLFIAFLTMLMMKTQVVDPVNQLLRVAHAVHQGNWQARAEIHNQHEIGTLANLFNVMVARLADVHAHLEEKVREQTQNLANSNRRLQLLYKSMQLLSHMESQGDDPDLMPPWQDWMNILRHELPLKHINVCLYQHNPEHASPMVIDSLKPMDLCVKNKCNLCAPQEPSAANAHLKRIPLLFGKEPLGFLIYEVDHQRWQETDEELLQALAKNLALALIRQMQIDDRNRLAIHDERSVLARELHDSLAQELVYLKMQVSLIEGQMKTTPTLSNELTKNLKTVKTGLHHALQELRELIATFRLAQSDGSLMEALMQMKTEFMERCQLTVAVDVRLPYRLEGATESHMLRLIREALINITKHAKATTAKVSIHLDELGAEPSQVVVEVEDNGQGLTTPINVDAPASHHFGMNIMQDRARMLGGQLTLGRSKLGGVLLSLIFPYRARPKIPMPT